jgi:hypothetical protein
MFNSNFSITHIEEFQREWRKRCWEFRGAHDVIMSCYTPSKGESLRSASQSIAFCYMKGCIRLICLHDSSIHWHLSSGVLLPWYHRHRPRHDFEFVWIYWHHLSPSLPLTWTPQVLMTWMSGLSDKDWRKTIKLCILYSNVRTFVQNSESASTSKITENFVIFSWFYYGDMKEESVILDIV